MFSAHEGHQGIAKTKALLRKKVWFPGIDSAVEKKVKLPKMLPSKDPASLLHQDSIAKEKMKLYMGRKAYVMPSDLKENDTVLNVPAHQTIQNRLASPRKKEVW